MDRLFRSPHAASHGLTSATPHCCSTKSTRTRGVRARILLVEAERALQRLGVTVLTGRTVIWIDAAGVTLDGRDGGADRIASRAVVWAAGVTATGLAD